jgi:branched-chain amino acid transport system ATP-binding protein
MSENLLNVHELEGGYGEVQVLRKISFRQKMDERIGLFGPNGHGKTTLLQTISGLLTPWRGEITFKGVSIKGMRPRQILDKGLVHVPQGNTMFPRMTVTENLYAGAYLKSMWSKRRNQIEKVFTIFPKLAERRRQRVVTLSGGERQMLAIGAGLMVDCTLLVLDEPTLGLSPIAKGELGDAIGRITDSGVNLLIVEQDFEFMCEFTDRFYMIEGGKVVHDSTSRDIDKSEIMKMYFGKLEKKV